MISRAAVEQAVRAWVLTSVTPAPFSIPAAQVYFADQQGAPSMTTPRVSIGVKGTRQHAQDGTVKNFDAARPAGQELEYITHGSRLITIAVETFAPNTVGTAVTAWDLAAACQAWIANRPVRAALNTAGLGVLQVGDVMRLPRVVSGRHEDRCLLEVVMHAIQSVSSRAGYFDKVRVEADVDGETATFDVEL